MPQIIREFLSGDALVALFAIGAALCLFACWRTWRSPNSWHLDGATNDVTFHGWPSLLMAGSGAGVFAVLTVLTF